MNPTRLERKEKPISPALAAAREWYGRKDGYPLNPDVGIAELAAIIQKHYDPIYNVLGTMASEIEWLRQIHPKHQEP